MAEIHAFKPDGTPSPGAQTALDKALATTASKKHKHKVDDVIGLDEALTERAEPLSRTALRAALTRQQATGVGIVFAGSSTIEGDKATTADRRPVQRISAYLTPRNVSTSVSSSSETPTPGVQVWSWGIGGSTSANYLTSSHYAAVGSIKPVVMVHVVGSNDFSGGRAPADYETNVRDHLSELRSASPDTVHLFIGQHQRNEPATGSHPWEDYTEVLHRIAADFPEQVEVLDLWERYAAIGIPGADPWSWLHTDGIHLTDAAYRYFADWIAEHLGIPTPIGIAETYTAEPHGGGTVDNGTVIFSVTIPARPYPRTGTVTGVLFARKRGVETEFRLTAGGKLLITRANIPSDTTVDGVTMPLTMQIDVPAREAVTVTGTASGGEPVYYTSNPDWANLTAHVSAC